MAFSAIYWLGTRGLLPNYWLDHVDLALAGYSWSFFPFTGWMMWSLTINPCSTYSVPFDIIL